MAIIYMGTNLVTGKSYIGQTKMTLEQRLYHSWWGHYTRAEREPGSSSYISGAIRKYGKENFKWKVLEEIDISKLSKDDARLLLDEREKFWIAKYDTFHNGYNQTEGGTKTTCSLKGRKMTWGKKVWATRYKNGTWHSKGRPGAVWSEESRKKLSNSRKGKKMPPRSDEYRKMLSETRKGNKNMLGKHPSEETRRKQSQARLGMKFSEEHKKNISRSSAGRVWVTNGRENHLTKNYQFYLDNGWVKGRSKSQARKDGCRQASLGRRWINNGKENKFTKRYSIYIEQGWTYGRL